MYKNLLLKRNPRPVTHYFEGDIRHYGILGHGCCSNS